MVVDQVPGQGWETSEPCRMELRASLPPRKRLLAGLKQNGWFSNSWQDSTSGTSHLSTEQKKREDLTMDASNLPNNAQKGEEDRKELLSVADKEVILDEQRDLDHDRCRVKSFMQTQICSDTCSLESMVNGSSGDVKLASLSTSDCGVRSCRLKRKATSLKHEVEAAKLTAAMAAKTATEAKATAAVKAEAAAKSAAIAKAALDAAAVVACKAASSSQRHLAKAASRIKRKKKKKNVKRTRTDSRNLQMPPPVNDEELARQLHRAMNSSPRILRSTSHQAKGTRGATVVSMKWIEDSLGTSIEGRKNLQVQPKDERRQGVAKKNSKLSESKAKMESQSTEESSKSKVIDATAVTSIQKSGLSVGEHEGDTTTDDPQVEKVDTNADGNLGNFSLKEEKFSKHVIVNRHRHLGRATVLESAFEALDVTGCEPVDTPKRVHDFKVPKPGRGQNKIANGEAYTGNKSDNIEITIVGSKDEPGHLSIEEQKKEAGMVTKELGRLMETFPSTLGKQLRQQSDRDSCKEKDINKPGTTIEDKKKETEHMNNSTTGFVIESGDDWYMHMELKQHAEIQCPKTKRDSSSLVKQRSLDTRSKTLSNCQSRIGGAQVGEQSLPKGSVKGISSGTESFIGERNVAHFGSSSAVPVRTPALRKHAFANGSSTRNA